MRKTKATNPQLIELIKLLKRQSRENKAEIWRDIAERLSKPSRRSSVVNLSRLNRYTQKNTIVAVPGKVLATGEINHAITIAAFTFSENAIKKIGRAKGKCISFPDLIKRHPTGSNVEIIG